MRPTKKAIQQAFLNRINKASKPIVLDPHFNAQNAFILDKSRYIAAQCSRRAGKTNGLAIRLFKALEEHPKSQCIYLSLTRESAHGIMWPVLQELNDQFQLGCEFVESRLTMIHPNGSKLILFGADMKNFIKRLKGRKFPAVAIDESQDFGDHLRSLIDDVLTPSIADYPDSWLAIVGTPGPVPKGYFYEAMIEKKYGYSRHEWTILENPYMPNPQEFISEMMKARAWDDNNATYLREWRNKWVLDVNSLWIRYEEKRNDYTNLPTIVPRKYNFVMGVDLGFKDSDAIAILAFEDNSPVTYLVEEVITPKQGLTELATQIETMIKKYNPFKIVMDEGGLGKKIAEELRRQKALPIHPADKALKQQNVEFLNDSLRTGHFRANSKSRFALDSYMVQIDWDKSTPNKIVVKKQPHSDIIDAVLYAFKESHAHTYKAPVKQLIPGSKEWLDAQNDTMFEAELEGLSKEAEMMRELNDPWGSFDA